MAVCDLSLRLGSSESRKTLVQKFVFQIGTLNPQGINERFFYSTNLFFVLSSTHPVVLPTVLKSTQIASSLYRVSSVVRNGSMSPDIPRVI